MIGKKEVYEVKYTEDDKIKVLAEVHVKEEKFHIEFKDNYGTPRLSMVQLKAFSTGLDEIIDSKKGQTELAFSDG
jgi:hypothetical protein